MKQLLKKQLILNIRLLTVWLLVTLLSFLCYRITATPFTIGALLISSTMSIGVFAFVLLAIHKFVDYKEEEQEELY